MAWSDAARQASAEARKANAKPESAHTSAAHAEAGHGSAGHAEMQQTQVKANIAMAHKEMQRANESRLAAHRDPVGTGLRAKEIAAGRGSGISRVNDSHEMSKRNFSTVMNRAANIHGRKG